MIDTKPVLDRYRGLVAQREATRLALAAAEAGLTDARRLSETAEQVRVFFNLLSEEQRKLLEERVQALVDYGVQAVFGRTHRFRVRSELRGKSVRTEFFLVENDLELPLLEATGGGIGDVVSFLLRVVMLCLSRPAQRRLLVLDEPFKFLSADKFGALNQLIGELVTALGVQVIAVSHRPELVDAATTVVSVKKQGLVSTAEIRNV